MLTVYVESKFKNLSVTICSLIQLLICKKRFWLLIIEYMVFLVFKNSKLGVVIIVYGIETTV